MCSCFSSPCYSANFWPVFIPHQPLLSLCHQPVCLVFINKVPVQPVSVPSVSIQYVSVPAITVLPVSMPAVPVHFCTSCFSPACLCASLKPILYCISFCSDYWHSRFETLSTPAFLPCNMSSPRFPKKYDSSFRQIAHLAKRGPWPFFKVALLPDSKGSKYPAFCLCLWVPVLWICCKVQLQKPCPNFVQRLCTLPLLQKPYIAFQFLRSCT